MGGRDRPTLPAPVPSGPCTAHLWPGAWLWLPQVLAVIQSRGMQPSTMAWSCSFASALGSRAWGGGSGQSPCLEGVWGSLLGICAEKAVGLSGFCGREALVPGAG